MAPSSPVSPVGAPGPPGLVVSGVVCARASRLLAQQASSVTAISRHIALQDFGLRDFMRCSIVIVGPPATLRQRADLGHLKLGRLKLGRLKLAVRTSPLPRYRLH